MNFKKIILVFVSGFICFLITPVKADAFKWALCQSVYSDKAWSCNDTGGVIGSGKNCNAVEYDTKSLCEVELSKITAAEIEAAKPTPEQLKAKQAAAQAEQEADAAQATADAANKEQINAAKKAQAVELAKASELMCDCSKGGGQCKDDFTVVQDAVDYCNACGLAYPQTSAVGCPLGSKEIGPFSCSCGSGEKAVCSNYDTFSELNTKCAKTCTSANWACPVDTSASLKKLQKAAKILNPAGFEFGSAGVTEIMGKLINFLLFPIGMFAMVMYIWAGFLWMTAQGNSENVGKAKTTIVWTTLGIVITLASYLIVKLIFTEIL